MNIILSLATKLEDVPRKLQILMRDDISQAHADIEELIYGEHADSAAKLISEISKVRGLLFNLDEKLQLTSDLLRDQQRALLDSTEPSDAAPTGMSPEELQVALDEYDSGVGLPTGSE